jgi:hypothetical protein
VQPNAKSPLSRKKLRSIPVISFVFTAKLDNIMQKTSATFDYYHIKTNISVPN